MLILYIGLRIGQRVAGNIGPSDGTEAADIVFTMATRRFAIDVVGTTGSRTMWQQGPAYVVYIWLCDGMMKGIFLSFLVDTHCQWLLGPVLVVIWFAFCLTLLKITADDAIRPYFPGLSPSRLPWTIRWWRLKRCLTSLHQADSPKKLKPVVGPSVCGRVGLLCIKYQHGDTRLSNTN